MVFKKTIVQVYSGNEPFGFDDFIRGTLRLFNYAIDRNIDVRVNIEGSEFEQYMIVSNFVFDRPRVTPKIYYMDVDQEILVKELDLFMISTEPIYVLTSNVWLDRNDIYNMSYLGFDAIVRYRESLYALAEQKVKSNLLYRSNPDNLMYGYSIIYLHCDEVRNNATTRQIASIASQIRKSLDLNKDIMVFSNNIQFTYLICQYIEMNSAAVYPIDDSRVDFTSLVKIPSIRDLIVDFIILLKAKKIYRFSDVTYDSVHTIKYNEEFKQKGHGTNIYDTAFHINNIIGNLDISLAPLYYETSRIAGTPPPLPSLLNKPSGLALDTSGNIYISDTVNNCIRRMDTSGNITLYAGSGVAGYKDGSSEEARFNRPTAIAIDVAGNLYVADTRNNSIRIVVRNYTYGPYGEVTSVSGLVGTLIGNSSTNYYTTVATGVGSAVTLNNPAGIAVDSSGSVYFSDTGHNRICKVTSGGNFITLAGSASENGVLLYSLGYVNGEKTEASFNAPTALTLDLKGNIFVADTGNNVIRRITPSGKVTTVAGSGQGLFKEGRRETASFNAPTGICIDSNNILYISDTGNNVIRRITTDGNVIPVVGSSNQLAGSTDGYGSVDAGRSIVPLSKRALFSAPGAIIVDPSHTLYVADVSNNAIRKIVPTFSKPTKIRPVAMQALRISHAPGVAYTLGPTLSAPPPPPNTIVYGHQRGSRR